MEGERERGTWRKLFSRTSIYFSFTGGESGLTSLGG